MRNECLFVAVNGVVVTMSQGAAEPEMHFTSDKSAGRQMITCIGVASDVGNGKGLALTTQLEVRPYTLNY